MLKAGFPYCYKIKNIPKHCKVCIKTFKIIMKTPNKKSKRGEEKCKHCNKRKVYDSIGLCIVCNYYKMLGIIIN